MTAAPSPQSSYNATGTLRYVLTGARHDGLAGPRNWYVDGGGCMPETVEQQWRRVRVEHGKNGSQMVTDERGTRYVGDNVQALHLILSADDSEPGGIEGVHRRNKQIAERLAEGGWQYVIATQDDGRGGKRHSHVVFNAVHPKTGRSMSGRHPAKDINKLREVVDEVLAEHGIDNKALHAERQQVRYSARERERQASGAYVWKDDLDGRLGASLAASTDRESFKAQALDRGVEVRYHGRGLSFGFTDADGEDRKIPAKSLGSKWRAKNLDQRLAERAEQVRAAEAARAVESVPTVEPAKAAPAVRRRGRVDDAYAELMAAPTKSAAELEAQAAAEVVEKAAPSAAERAVQPPVEKAAARPATPSKTPLRDSAVAAERERERDRLRAAPYDRRTAVDGENDAMIQALQRTRTGRMRASDDGPDRPETALDLVHDRAAKYKARDGVSDAEAVTRALDEPTRGGGASMRERGRAAAEQAAKGKPVPTISYGDRRTEAMVRVRAAQRRMAADDRARAQRKSQGQDRGMSM